MCTAVMLGRFNNQTFAYVAAFGLFTDVAYETEPGSEEYSGTSGICAGGCQDVCLDIQVLPYESNNRG